jgi:hypothetical protein
MTATDRKPQRTTLFIGLSIPLCMMLFVAGAIYLPRWFINIEPATIDFIYSMGEHDADTLYRLNDHHLVREQHSVPDHYDAKAADRQFFIHEVSSNNSREITFEQAAKFYLDPSNLAPDGYRIEYGRRAGWFPFDNHRDFGRQFLIKQHFSQELNLQHQDSTHYYNSYRFHGWVVPQ